jgi:hypothetical protein
MQTAVTVAMGVFVTEGVSVGEIVGVDVDVAQDEIKIARKTG